jgi:hypothetical protein
MTDYYLFSRFLEAFIIVDDTPSHHHHDDGNEMSMLDAHPSPHNDKNHHRYARSKT